MISAIVVVLAAVLYLAIGLYVAHGFQRDGQPAAAAAAVFTWPQLLETGAAGPRLRMGPAAGAIRKGVSDLRGALDEPGVEGLFAESDVERIELALMAADARVGTVDRLLADPTVLETAEGQRLQAAREQAATEVQTVLKNLVQLRVQLGLVALAGETGPVRDRLMELSARLTALEEVASPR